MNVVVVGGNLQGVETAYLAMKAGWRVTVIDRRPDAPAAGMCSRYIQSDLLRDSVWQHELRSADLVVPATENQAVLDALALYSTKQGVPLAFDPDAYRVTSSKILTNRLLQKLGTPMPALWPDCDVPVVVKPSSGSGSDGVRVIYDLRVVADMAESLNFAERFVCQEYVEGPSFSIEVVGRPGNYTALQVTDLFMDEYWDCKRVAAPTVLSGDEADAFHEESIRMAEALELHGLMDVEVILHDGRLKVLELDARMPSQTPTVVFQSTGINMLERTAAVFLTAFQPAEPHVPQARAVIYEHVRLEAGRMILAGEHLMSQCGPVELLPGFFGADEAITNFARDQKNWSATLIFTGHDRDDVYARRNRTIEAIAQETGTVRIIDSSPAEKRGDAGYDQTG